jgi:hypothetical protein
MRQETYLREAQTSTEMGSCARICKSTVVSFDGVREGREAPGRRKASTNVGDGGMN